jgi:RNA polymerase sigma factor (sigma-70 family)
MMTLAPTSYDHTPDADLWQLVLQGSAAAFEALVRRHQSAVCAVAYNACGDLALSEDVAQETFWAAWRGRTTLEQPARLRAWMCSIARNLGKNARRREARAPGPTVSLDTAADVSADMPDPAALAVSREEESVVWQTLAQIPESYREPLILFYREQQSVAEVAAALDLSEDAVKQRLSRGRGMLRDRMAKLVEGALGRSRPGQAFTVAVVAGLTASSLGAKTALAGTGAGAAGPALKAAGAAAVGPALKAAGAGLTGGLLGSVIGLAGAWLGIWVPAQLAPSLRERDYLLRTGRRMLFVSVLFAAALAVLVVAWAGSLSVAQHVIVWAGWTATYMAYITTESVRLAGAITRLRAEAVVDPNNTPLRAGLTSLADRYRGRVFQSRTILFGLPLIDVNVSDPAVPGGTDQMAPRRIARGWVAVGDEANGILLAVGGVARGTVAVGGRTLGLLSIGGLAVGLVAFGGLALGGVAIGGLGVGVFGLGGLGRLAGGRGRRGCLGHCVRRRSSRVACRLRRGSYRA